MTKEEMAEFLYEALQEQAQSRLDGDGLVMVCQGPISRRIGWDLVSVQGSFDFLELAEKILARCGAPARG